MVQKDHFYTIHPHHVDITYSIAKHFNIKHLPKVIVTKWSGRLLSEEGRELIQKKGYFAFKLWHDLVFDEDMDMSSSEDEDEDDDDYSEDEEEVEDRLSTIYDEPSTGRTINEEIRDEEEPVTPVILRSPNSVRDISQRVKQFDLDSPAMKPTIDHEDDEEIFADAILKEDILKKETKLIHDIDMANSGTDLAAISYDDSLPFASQLNEEDLSPTSPL
eukprot:CAMPEP_0117425542 /NCGR_PEP_ID=MMETSP0758-20121206/5804_1 /TAXON_ID=63605 /ORGANISM="Percolomonas cosmopolitus, Strain AE-1 (ATCC 50343)" /LENGTH=217 /DNA_ID=CAMNT_0005210111 /DNA_START=185 /DNA_END=835 /DNA_ORIENTATION=+